MPKSASAQLAPASSYFPGALREAIECIKHVPQTYYTWIEYNFINGDGDHGRWKKDDWHDL